MYLLDFLPIPSVSWTLFVPAPNSFQSLPTRSEYLKRVRPSSQQQKRKKRKGEKEGGKERRRQTSWGIGPVGEGKGPQFVKVDQMSMRSDLVDEKGLKIVDR